MIDVDLEKLAKLPDFDHPPQRVVSLIPSITESLFDLGFGPSVVGVTDYCIHPADKLSGVQRVGGPKTPDVSQIINIAPELVFVNQEENSPQAITELVEAGLSVWVTFPKSVDEAIDILRNISAIFHTDKTALQIKTLQMAVDYARDAVESLPTVRYFCPIWQEKEGDLNWWMTFNRNTYSSDLLSVFGGENVFSDRKRAYPLEADLGLAGGEDPGSRDTRYPRVSAKEIIDKGPEVILLPNEPFQFNPSHKNLILDELGDTPAVRTKRVSFVDGSLLTWHGTRIGKALQLLPDIFM